jgi:N-glycosylase/DNA lyase
MNKLALTIKPPKNFILQSTINSHGWYDLAPFLTNEEKSELSTIIAVDKKFAHCKISTKNTMLKINVSSKTVLSSKEKMVIKKKISEILRLEESFDELYKICTNEPHLQWVKKYSAGRLLRSPTVFEDVVKMLFTTNCSWSLTKIQTTNLVTKLGEKISETEYSFPSPEAISPKSEQWLRKNLSCGYRAPYLLELCKKISTGKLELESLRSSNATTQELYEFLRSIKGVGHYAAGNLLKLLGRYDYLGIDSWVRKRFSELHHNGRKVSDATIEKYYKRFGKWRGLICWMEITKDWHV